MAKIPEVSEDTRKNFGIWLLINQELPGGTVLYNHYSNLKPEGKNRQNRTGHFKQCFYAAYRFIAENPAVRDQLAAEVDGLAGQDGMLNLQEHAILALWVDHLLRHTNDRGETWSYRILRNELLENVGGTRPGGGGKAVEGSGGGAGGTLQRMLPLLARYMRDKNLP